MFWVVSIPLFRYGLNSHPEKNPQRLVSIIRQNPLIVHQVWFQPLNP
jgi:hypothetical protein